VSDISLNKLLKKIGHIMNESPVSENYFYWFNLNVNETDAVVYFSQRICQFLLICFKVELI